MKLLKTEESFIPIKKHKEIINKKELESKIKKMELIEKILFLQKRINELLNHDIVTNDTNRADDSFEEQTINDISFNEFSLIKDIKDSIGIGVNYSYNFNNKDYFKEKPLYENKIIKIKPNEINVFPAKFIKSMKDKKDNK